MVIKLIFQIVLSFIASLFIFTFVFVLFKMFGIFLKCKFRKKTPFKRRYKHFIYKFMYSSIFKYFDFFKWSIYDLLKGKEKFKLFGIWAFTGYFGQGKTLGAVTLAKQYQKQYPDKNISIFTNFNMVGQSGKITCWEDMINLPKCSIIIFDEIQSTFTSQKFKDFPIDLLWKLTQCRKNQLMVFASTPVFHRMAIQIRENVDYVVTCKNVLNLDRYFRYVFYKAPEYEKHEANSLKLFKAREFILNFVATNHHYRAYDTTQIVDRFDIEQKTKKVTKLKA